MVKSSTAHHDEIGLGGRQDRVTGLPGVEALREAIADAVGEGKASYGGKPVLVAFDIENFKTYNLVYGFEGGDVLLKSVADFLTEEFAGCVTVRMSEDHFFAVTSLERAKSGALTVHERVHDIQRDINIELKAGIYPLVRVNESMAAACDAARLACNSIKRQSEMVYRLYDEQLGVEAVRKRYVVDNLDRALAKGWIKVYYQPIVRTQTGRVCAFEVLARWVDPFQGMLSPGAFIPTLEDYHLVHKLDVHILRLACADYRKASRSGRVPLPFSINFSRLDFELCDVVSAVQNASRDFGVPPSMIHIEVTESALGGNAEMMRSRLTELRRLGYPVWMDDFGSGYSTLNLLKDFEFDVLKIDMLLLNDFREEGRATKRSVTTRVVIASIVDMAKQLGIQTLAEGVETEEQLEFLRKVGCEKAQGFFFSKPLPREELFETLKERGIKFEDAAHRAYYDTVGKVNLIGARAGKLKSALEEDLERPMATGVSDNPMAVVEHLGHDRLVILSSNDAFDELLKSEELEGMLGRLDISGEPIFDKDSDLVDQIISRRILAAFSIATNLHTEQTLDFIRSGRLYAVRLSFVAECDGRASCLMSLYSLSSGSSVGVGDDLSSALKSLCAVFTRIDMVALDDSFAKTLYNSSSRYRPFLNAFAAGQSIERYAEENIHESDREAFVNFYDLTTLPERFAQTEAGELTMMFRTIDVDGSYSYQAYTLVPHLWNGVDCALSFVGANVMLPGEINEVLPG